MERSLQDQYLNLMANSIVLTYLAGDDPNGPRSVGVACGFIRRPEVSASSHDVVSDICICVQFAKGHSTPESEGLEYVELRHISNRDIPVEADLPTCLDARTAQYRNATCEQLEGLLERSLTGTQERVREEDQVDVINQGCAVSFTTLVQSCSSFSARSPS